MLPEEYIVECNNAHETETVANYIKDTDGRLWGYFRYVYKSKLYSIYNTLWGKIMSEVSNLPVLTFKQWEQMKESKIIGYKLKEDCGKYKHAAYIIAGFIEGGAIPLESFLEGDGAMKLRLKEAGVLDLWFEPVYGPEFKAGDWVIGWHTDNHNYIENAWQIDRINGNYVYVKNSTGHNTHLANIRKATSEEIEKAQCPQITINGYKAEFFDDYVKFGCAKVSKELFIDLFETQYSDTNRSIESVTIGKGTFTKKQIKQIAEYYLNK